MENLVFASAAKNGNLFIANCRKSGSSFRFSVEDDNEYWRMSDAMKEEFANTARTNVTTVEKGDWVAVRRDAEWNRAIVQKVEGDNVKLSLVDMDDSVTYPMSKLFTLPSSLSSVPPLMKHYNLAFVAPHKSVDRAMEAECAFGDLVGELKERKIIEINELYSIDGTTYAQVIVEIRGERVDVGKALIEDGFAVAGESNEEGITEMEIEYAEAEEKAREDIKNMKKMEGGKYRKRDRWWLAHQKLRKRLGKKNPESATDPNHTTQAETQPIQAAQAEPETAESWEIVKEPSDETTQSTSESMINQVTEYFNSLFTTSSHYKQL